MSEVSHTVVDELVGARVERHWLKPDVKIIV